MAGVTLYKVLIPIENTFKARTWCRQNFGYPVIKHIYRSWRKGGTIVVMDEEESRWTYRRNKRTSTWKFQDEEDAIWFKLTWADSVDKKK